MDTYDIVIVGGGPAGLSAAARAAENLKNNSSAPSYLLLEGFTEPAKTIYDYQKAKPVMDEPGYLDLRSPLVFSAGLREEVLGNWTDGLNALSVNVRYQSLVSAISGSDGEFVITTEDGFSVGAGKVILSIGLQGNPRRLGVEYDNEPFAQYTLVDPDEYASENIFVIGAGDAAIENAIALSKHNHVTIVNRRAEFSRAKQGNLNAIVAHINDPKISLNCLYEASIKSVEPNAAKDRVQAITLSTPEGEKNFPVNRIIARLGANPPRKLIESFGVEFPNASPTALPELSEKYESNVPGLYIIGALAGYPLIKQAMNQGYDVVEYISGNEVEPVDYALLKLQFSQLPYQLGVDQMLDLLRERIPMFRQINKLAMKELIIEGGVFVTLQGENYREARKQLDAIEQQLNKELQAGVRRAMPALPTVLEVGSLLYKTGDYSSSLYTIVDGGVEITYDEFPDKVHALSTGEFFGENSLISGAARQETVALVQESVVFETPRRIAMKLMNSIDSVREGIDWIHTARALSAKFAPNVPLRELYSIVSQTRLITKEAGEEIYSELDEANSLFLIRHGNVSLHGTRGQQKSVFLDQLKSGALLGEMAVMGDPLRRETALAELRSELVEVDQQAYQALLVLDGERIKQLKNAVSGSLSARAELASQRDNGAMIDYLMGEGLGEATNAFLLDEELCVGCDNCEVACAETHGGVSRLKRAEGSSFEQMHIPISCRHCEIPHCMKDCPPNAIKKTADGEVYIDDSCIGCGNCVTNCPYDAIELKKLPEHQPSLLKWLFFGLGSAPGDIAANAQGSGQKKAVKCDACKDDAAGPACVRACPTGAAARVEPIKFISAM